MKAADHLAPEVQFGYRNQLLTPEELRVVDAHISTCAVCREALASEMDARGMVDSLRAELESEVPQQRPLAFVWYGIAAAILIAVSAAIWVGFHRPAAPEVASLQSRETPEERESVKAALGSGRLPLPDFAKDLTATRQILMGRPGDEPSLELIAPVGTAVLSARPRFRWKTLGSDWTYVVRVFGSGFEMVATSGVLTSGEWTPKTDLPEGVIYQWQILGQRGTERVTFPHPPQVPPRFRVLDSATSARLREVAKSHADDPLLLAIEYSKAGLFEDARRELEKAKQRSSDGAAIQRLIDGVGR